LGLSILFHGNSFAQDTAVGSDTAAVAIESSASEKDSSALTTEESAAASETKIESTAAPTVSSAPAAAAEKPGIPTQVYINFFYYVLLFLLVCFIVGIIGKVMDIYGITRQMQGYDRSQEIWGKSQGWFFLVGLFVFLYGIYWSYANHGAQSFREAATEHGAAIDVMFIITVIITTIVLVITHILLFGFAFQYRGSEKRKAYFYPHNNTLEKIWTIIPAIVLTILVLFGFFTWRTITNVPIDIQKSAIQIEVTGEQFAWTVRYGGRDNQIGKHNYKLVTPTNGLGIDFNDKSALDDIRAGDIVIPVGKQVRFTINSKDVLHSFYIPEFRVQMNAVPGMPTFFQIVAKYTTEEMRERVGNPNYNFILLCSKICGSGHYNMQKTVRVVSEEEYKEWLSQQSYFFDEDMRKEFQSAQAKEVDEGDKMAVIIN
jgi:cytochrome c oxidase subunit 2